MLILGFVLGGIVILALYAWFIEPAWLKLAEYEVEVDPKKLDSPTRLLFLSDPHAGYFFREKVIQKHLDRLYALHRKNPFQAILLGGDYLDLHPRYLDQVKRFLASLRKFAIPVVAVLGNHDHVSFGKNIQSLVTTLEEGGAQVLRNQSYLLKTKSGTVAIIGLEDIQQSWQKKHRSWEDYRRQTESLDWYEKCDLAAEKNIVRVLLAHNPDAVYLPGTTPEVALAGHTHGGQFAWVDWLHGRFFPGIYPPSSFITASGKLYAHLTTLIINRGIGGTRLPARFWRRPEAVALTLTPAQLPPRLIIGISGKPRSGKDTAANLIQQIFPGIHRIAFADALKEQFDAVHQTNTRHDQDEKIKHRLELHAFSAEKLAKDPLHWIKIVLRTPPPLLITDVRFPLEEEVLRREGAILIRIEASSKTLRARLGELYDSQATHPNEKWLDQITNWHYVIPNNGSLVELEKRVYKIGEAIKADQSLKADKS